MLLRQGELVAARDAYKRAHELGSKRSDWREPSGKWLNNCECFLELESKLPAIRTGEIKLAHAGEQIDFGQLAYYKGLYALSARLFEQAFTSKPERAEELRRNERYRAACVAALAGCGQGQDASQLDDQARVRWRKQALTWLQADLKLWTRRLENGNSAAGAEVSQMLWNWQRDRDLAGLRDSAELAKLPPEEQQACKQLWADVATLHKRAARQK